MGQEVKQEALCLSGPRGTEPEQEPRRLNSAANLREERKEKSRKWGPRKMEKKEKKRQGSTRPGDVAVTAKAPGSSSKSKWVSFPSGQCAWVLTVPDNVEEWTPWH